MKEALIRGSRYDKLTKQNTHSSSADCSNAVKFCPYSAIVIHKIVAVQFAEREMGVFQETQNDENNNFRTHFSHYYAKLCENV